MTKISDVAPKNWKELQSEVARVLSECGFTVKEPYTVDTVRGKVEVDVFAEETVDGRRNIILCECKYWKSRIPKNVVHAFRTVLADVGANAGYVISSNGFQSGAGPAAEFTNLKLLTWDEFQEIFEMTWLRNYWPKQILRIFSLMTFLEDEDDNEYLLSGVRESDKPLITDLLKEYSAFAAFTLGQWHGASQNRDIKSKTLPLSSLPYEFEGLTPDIMNATCYRSYLRAQQSISIKAAKELYTILARNKFSQIDLLAQRLREMENLIY